MSIVKRIAGAAAIVATGASIGACGGDPLDVSSGTVIQHVTVVNTRDGSLAKDMSVIVDGGRIQTVTGGAVRIGGTATAIDASGKYLVPGFLDMHVHSMENADISPNDWPMMIASGITGVRQMSGSADIIARTRRLNADSAAGRVDAPEIVQVPGTIFGGQAIDEAGARAFVQTQKAAGSDFVKMVAGNRAALTGLFDEAKKISQTVSGHLPTTISASELSAMGMRSIEHLGGAYGVLLDCSTDEATLRPAILALPPIPLGFGGPTSPRVSDSNAFEPFYRAIQASYSEDKCKALAATFVKNNTWQVPTLIRVRTMAFSADAAYRTDPNLAYVGKTTRALWSQLSTMFETTVRPSAAASLQQFYALQLRATLLFKRQGVKMLAGTDTGGIWVIPGISLHQEFHELASAGLTPLEVLQSTTLNGAEFLGRQATMGTVDAGKRGDLVLLDANPIDDVANLDRIAGVMLGGKYFAKAALDQMKADVATGFARQSLGSVSALAAAGHRD